MLALRSTLLAVVALALFVPVHAQEPAAADADKVVRVELQDGSSLVGTVVRETSDEIVLLATGEVEVTVPRAQVRRLATFEGRIQDGRLVIFDPNRTRLLFTPTARPLGRGTWRSISSSCRSWATG